MITILQVAFGMTCLIIFAGLRTRDRRLAEHRVSWGLVWAAGTLALVVLASPEVCGRALIGRLRGVHHRLDSSSWRRGR